MSVDLSVYDIGDLGLDDEDEDFGYDDDYGGSCYYDDGYESDETETTFAYSELIAADANDFEDEEEVEDPYREDESDGFKRYMGVPYPWNLLPKEAFFLATDITRESIENGTSMLSIRGIQSGELTEWLISNGFEDNRVNGGVETLSETLTEFEVNKTSPLPTGVNWTKSGRLTKKERRAAFREMRLSKRRLRLPDPEVKVADLLEDERVKGWPGEIPMTVQGDDGVT